MKTFLKIVAGDMAPGKALRPLPSAEGKKGEERGRDREAGPARGCGCGGCALSDQCHSGRSGLRASRDLWWRDVDSADRTGGSAWLVRLCEHRAAAPWVRESLYLCEGVESRRGPECHTLGSQGGQGSHCLCLLGIRTPARARLDAVLCLLMDLPPGGASLPPGSGDSTAGPRLHSPSVLLGGAEPRQNGE